VLAVLSDLTPPAAPVIAAPPASPTAAEPLEPPPPPEPKPTLALSAESGLAYGLLGNAATGTASVALRGRYRSIGVELGGFWGTPRFETVGPGVVQVGLLGGTALGCVWLGSGARPELGGCAGLALGSLSGSGHGYGSDGEASFFWLAGLAGVAARLPFDSHWAAGFSLFGLVPFRSQSFLVAPGAGGVGTSPGAILFRFGPEYRF
jgi:hypothetical protein